MSDKVVLTIEQQEAVSEIDHNLQIIACAGSGKTEVISRRIANILQNKQDVLPENIVAFTFTEKAAASLKNRIEKALGENNVCNIEKMYIGTIHGFCNNILKNYSECFKNHKILDTVKNHHFVTRYSDKCGMSDLNLEPYPRNINLFLQCIDKMIDDYDNADFWTQAQRNVLEKYRSCLYNHGYIDFSLMIFETLAQIETDSAVKEYISKIKYLVVDEYQDINNLQEKLISSIVKFGANICVVGDDDQTIYQFRGSNANNMISFPERYSNVRQIKLEKNFRCTPEIVDIADYVISHNNKRIDKKMISGVSDKPSEITGRNFSGKPEQYKAIAEKISDLHSKGVLYKEIAILVRKGKVIAPLSATLKKLGIPFETDSAEHFFAGDYFRRFVGTLQILDDLDKAKLYEYWEDLLDAQRFNIGFKYLRSCVRGGNFRLSTIIHEFCEKTDFLNNEAEDVETRRIDLEGFEKILDDYDEIYSDWQLSARITGVLKFLGTQAAEEYKYHSFVPKDPNADAIHIMTIHKAKGLEFNTVFLPELMEREFPVGNMGGKKYWQVLGGVFEENKDKYRSDFEDERKLFYVAVTRAKQNLYMTYELSSQHISRFVREAAESQYLDIDRSDFDKRFEPDCEFEKEFKDSKNTGHPEWEEERRQRQEYWATVKYARSQLYDYYGTACHFCPAAYGDLVRIKSMSPDEILFEASKNGLI
ncbi:MAG: ATP-dependent helicase [Clostridia bacterium]|nr:ATP-dependent helicase [Clostridia bacterium]